MKIRQLKFKIWLEWHILICRFWNWRIPMDINLYIEEWQKIDHRKDKSLSGKDFRFWLYLRKVDKKQPKCLTNILLICYK